MNLEYLPVLLLPFALGFPSVSEVDICEVSKEPVALIWAWDVRDGYALVLTVEQTKEVNDRGHHSHRREKGLENIFR